MFVQQRRFCVNPNDGFAQQLVVSLVEFVYVRTAYVRNYHKDPKSSDR